MAVISWACDREIQLFFAFIFFVIFRNGIWNFRNSIFVHYQPINWNPLSIAKPSQKANNRLVVFGPLVNLEFSSRADGWNSLLNCNRTLYPALKASQTSKWKTFRLNRFLSHAWCPSLKEPLASAPSVFKRNKLLRPDADKANGTRWKLPKQSQLKWWKEKSTVLREYNTKCWNSARPGVRCIPPQLSVKWCCSGSSQSSRFDGSRVIHFCSVKFFRVA